MLQTSFIFLNLFIIGCFFSPTLRSVALIAGLGFWLLFLLQALKRRSSLEFAATGLLRHFIPRNDSGNDVVSYLFLILLVYHLGFNIYHDIGFLPWLKSLVTSYAQWFWVGGLWSAANGIASSRKALLAMTRKTVVLTIIGAGSVLSLIILLQLLNLAPYFSNVYGVLKQPFTSSGVLLLSFFVTLANSKIDAKLEKMMVAALILQANAILALGQLSAWVALILALLLYVLMSKKLNTKQILIPLVAFVLVFAGIYQLSPRVQRKVLRLTSVESLMSSKSVQCRLKLWQINYQAWQESPAWGLAKPIAYNCQALANSKGLTHVHNIYLQNLVEGGLFRFIPWLLFFVVIGVYLARGIPAYFAGYVALALEGLLENWWGDSEVLSMFLVMAVIALTQTLKPSKV